MLYRAFEILPGAFAWLTLLGTVALSFYAPLVAAIFIIIFDTYWLLKTIYLSIHLVHNYRRLQHYQKIDWGLRLENLKHENLYHVVLLPFYNEQESVVNASIEALANSLYNKKRLVVVLAVEERAGRSAQKIAHMMEERYRDVFGHFLVTTHPDHIAGEQAGKGANISYAAEKVRTDVLNQNTIPYEDVIVSAFDIDTIAYPHYFSCLSWHFLTSSRPFRTSYQPIPFYNNNIWDTTALSRVAALSGTYWQMIEQERPERLVTFSSHALSFKTLYEIGYWQRNMVSEDSRIFWNAFMKYDGDYTVTPISYPVSMDANFASSYWKTLKNIYKQHRRWMWGVENIPYILFHFSKNHHIPFFKKVRIAFIQIEGFWSASTNAIFISLLGWLPLSIGGYAFNQTLLSFNLPIITQDLMTIAMLGLIVSSCISFKLLPKRPSHVKRWTVYVMAVQWVLAPITIMIFGAFPSLEAQTRLMFGKYLGFWVTPKHRSHT